jgi:hypothetical protein
MTREELAGLLVELEEATRQHDHMLTASVHPDHRWPALKELRNEKASITDRILAAHDDALDLHARLFAAQAEVVRLQARVGELEREVSGERRGWEMERDGYRALEADLATARVELARSINISEGRNVTEACSGDWPRCWCYTCETRRDLATARVGVERLRGALEKAQAAMWDAHYGKGIALEYVRGVDKEVRAALAPAPDQPAEKGRAATKPCTCDYGGHGDRSDVGACRGAKGLGKGWHCRQEGKEGSEP